MEASGDRSRVRPIVVDFLATLFYTFCIGVGTAVALGACVVLLAGEARGTEIVPMKAAEARQGTLLLERAPGETFAAPLLRTEVAIKVSGMVARARVRQSFRNPFTDWLEGVYVFPLPENAAVDHLRMKVGERSVEGEIRERGQAKRNYEQAKRGGRRAALLEQERPNLFTSSVANIGPNDEIVVEIEYQQTLRYDAGRFSLRFPMVVGPRYIPGFVPVAGDPGTGWGRNTNQVPDAARLTPPVLRASEGPVNPVSIRVELDAGVPLADIESPYHDVRSRVLDTGREVVELERGAVPAHRDFELVWTPAAQSAPRAAWFAERRGGRTYGLLMILPPNVPSGGRRLPREAVYVIDTSGSMSGTSIVQAKQALELALEGLAPEDRFNLIEFNSTAKALFREARPATRENRAEARGWVRGLRAQGGTEMAQALALALDGGESGERIRQVVFLTDGQVGNEAALFDLIREKLGDSRLFTVGIGSAPNSHFMSRAARAGRGTFTYIGRVEEVREKMAALFTKLESPVLKGVSVEWPEGAAAEMWPARIPDLYAGEPVMVTAALEQAAGSVRVSGGLGGTPWTQTLALAEPSGEENQGLGVLWARDKIAALSEAARESGPGEETRAHIIELALAHHLVTKYTSLVAIDRTPARPADLDLKLAALPTNLPEGQRYEAIFGPAPADATLGRLPQGATDSRFQLLTGALALLLAFVLFRRIGGRQRGWSGQA